MNKVWLIGRLTKDPDVRYIQGENPKAVAKYTLAVDRRRGGENTADFIHCTAFGKSAEFVEKYLVKGTKISVLGSIQTGSYVKNDQTIYTTEVVVEDHEFVEKKEQKAEESVSGWSIPEQEELPFH